MIPEKPQAVRTKRERMEHLRQVKSIGGIPVKSTQDGSEATAPMK